MLAPLAVALLAGSIPSDAVIVSPDLVEVSPDRPYADVSLQNVGSAPREIRADALAWTQDDDGRVVLAATESVSMFPSSAALEPGEQRRFRLTVVDRSPVRPGAYRIGFSVRDPATGAQVVALVPAFVLPARPVESAALSVSCPGKGSCEVAVTNTGNVQLRPARITLTIATGPASEAEMALDAWWLLPGGSRKYQVVVEPSSEARRVLVRATIGEVELLAAATLEP